MSVNSLFRRVKNIFNLAEDIEAETNSFDGDQSHPASLSSSDYGAATNSSNTSTDGASNLSHSSSNQSSSFPVEASTIQYASPTAAVTDPNHGKTLRPRRPIRITRPPTLNYDYSNIRISSVVVTNEDQRLKLVKFRGKIPSCEDSYTAIVDNSTNRLMYHRDKHGWIDTTTNLQAYDHLGNPSNDHRDVDLEISDIAKVQNDSWAVMFKGWPKSLPTYYTTDEITCNGTNELLSKFLKYMNNYCAVNKWQYLGGKKKKQGFQAILLDDQVQKLIRLIRWLIN